MDSGNIFIDVFRDFDSKVFIVPEQNLQSWDFGLLIGRFGRSIISVIVVIAQNVLLFTGFPDLAIGFFGGYAFCYTGMY